MMSFRQFQHLLPRARAWTLTPEKGLRKLFVALASIGDSVKGFVDRAWRDEFPEDTRSLSQWETQFGLTDADLTDEERRVRLTAAWRATGGQSPRYIQDRLQSAGFDVYVHEWWVPSSKPPVGSKEGAIPRNPRAFSFGDTDKGAFPLYVNQLLSTEKVIFPRAGVPSARAGADRTRAGTFLGFSSRQREYNIPSDISKWSYFLYIGGAEYPQPSWIPAARKDEFEHLIYSLKPAQVWVAGLVSFILAGRLDLSSAEYASNLFAGSAGFDGLRLGVVAAEYASNLFAGSSTLIGLRLDLSTAVYDS